MSLRALAVGLLALTGLALASCKEETPPVAPRPVLTMKVTPITTQTFGPFAGTVAARYETQLGFQTSGRMNARFVYVGDRVKTDERLATLDPTLANFALIRAKADVADSRAQLINAQGVADRTRALAAGGNATQATLDNALAALATAKARLDQSIAAQHVAEDQLGYTELHAHFDGVVTAWSAEVGQYVTNGQAVVTIARPDVREAVVDIPDELMVDVTPGMSFDVILQAAPTVRAKGIAREIGPLADAATRSHRVRLTLDQPTSAFRLGTMIAAEAEHAVAPHIILPRSAIVTDDRGPYVWLVAKDERSVARRDIKLGSGDDETVTVTDGLSAGDQVVIVGVHSLHEGEAVAGIANPSASKAQNTHL
jgi:RND family efflux transporter MFP subunit